MGRLLQAVCTILLAFSVTFLYLKPHVCLHQIIFAQDYEPMTNTWGKEAKGSTQHPPQTLSYQKWKRLVSQARETGCIGLCIGGNLLRTCVVKMHVNEMCGSKLQHANIRDHLKNKRVMEADQKASTCTEKQSVLHIPWFIQCFFKFSVIPGL